MKALLLYAVTAVAEIAGCYAVFLWLREARSIVWLAGAALALGLFAWLLTLHPQAGAGRVYAAYGGFYIAASIAWLWLVERQPPDRWDLVGMSVCLVGAAIIYFAPRG